MALTYNGTTIGTIVIKQGYDDIERKFTIQIRQGNCLAVLIHVRKSTPEELEKHPNGRYFHILYTFFGDEQHLKNMLKNEGTVLFDKVVSIKLNMFYKENYTLLKYFVLSGFKVTCFYKKV
ncbi:MAG: hypothetical protein PUB73_06155 [Bacteroidales bacterium]|nr:hypothetical protein [Bacteroidales bacterium]